MKTTHFDEFGPLHTNGLEIKKGGVDRNGVGLFTTLERNMGDPIGFYAGIPKTHVTREEEKFAIEVPGFDLAVVPPIDSEGGIDFETYPMAASNEPPEGEEANMVLVADRLYELHNNTYTVLSFYMARHVQPNTELTWFYGNTYERNYRVGSAPTAQFNIYMTIPRLNRLLAHRPDAIFELSELERLV